MKISIVQSDANGLVFEKTNQMDFRELFTYDLDGKPVQAYYEYNPDVMTSSRFGSVKNHYIVASGITLEFFFKN